MDFSISRALPDVHLSKKEQPSCLLTSAYHLGQEPQKYSAYFSLRLVLTTSDDPTKAEVCL